MDCTCPKSCPELYLGIHTFVLGLNMSQAMARIEFNDNIIVLGLNMSEAMA